MKHAPSNFLYACLIAGPYASVPQGIGGSGFYAGSWLNHPFEKYVSKWESSSNRFKHNKDLSNHHLVYTLGVALSQDASHQSPPGLLHVQYGISINLSLSLASWEWDTPNIHHQTWKSNNGMLSC